MIRAIAALLLLAVVAVAVWRDRHRHDFDDFILYGIFNRAFRRPNESDHISVDEYGAWGV